MKCIFVWIVCMNRLEFFQNHLLDFQNHGLNQQISIRRTLFNDNVWRNSRCIANFMDRLSQTLGVVWFFPKNKTAFLKIQSIAAFPSSRYQSIFSTFVLTNGEVNCCIWFLATRIWGAEIAEIAKAYELSWIQVFQNISLEFSSSGPNQHLLKRRSSFSNNILENVSYIGNFEDLKRKKVRKFFDLPQKSKFCSPELTAFHPSGFEATNFSDKRLHNCQKVHLAPCNRNVMVQTSPKMKFTLIRLDFQSRFPPKQMSVFLPSRAQSALLFSYSMIQYLYFFVIFPPNFW